MRIYFSCDVTTRGYPVHWIDEKGRERLNTFPQAQDAGQSCDEFEKEHRGAVYLRWDKFCARLQEIAAEEERLASWNRASSGESEEEEWPWPMPESPYDPDPRDFGGHI